MDNRYGRRNEPTVIVEEFDSADEDDDEDDNHYNDDGKGKQQQSNLGDDDEEAFMLQTKEESLQERSTPVWLQRQPGQQPKDGRRLWSAPTPPPPRQSIGTCR